VSRESVGNRRNSGAGETTQPALLGVGAAGSSLRSRGDSENGRAQKQERRCDERRLRGRYRRSPPIWHFVIFAPFWGRQRSLLRNRAGKRAIGITHEARRTKPRRGVNTISREEREPVRVQPFSTLECKRTSRNADLHHAHERSESTASSTSRQQGETPDTEERCTPLNRT
jgi:hypothetical protein